MKSILILFVIFTTAFDVFALPQGMPDEIRREVQQKVDKCLMQSGIDPSMATPEKMQSDAPEVKCFHACMFKETGMMNNDGTINKKALLTFPPDMPEDLKQHLESTRRPCVDLKGDNECETGYLLFKCMTAGQGHGQ